MIKNLIFAFLFSLTALVVGAQTREFIHIQVGDYTIVDRLPPFTEEVNLGQISHSNFDVEIVYPEYTALTSKEKELVKEMEAAGYVDGGLHLEKYASRGRGDLFLSVTFSPIVKKDGRWMRLSSCKLKITPNLKRTKQSVSSTPSKTERWTKNSVLSTGKWAKIRVSSEGIYALSADQLSQMGFKDLDRVKVYGYGGLMQDEAFDFSSPSAALLSTATPDDLLEVPVLHQDRNILFWAEGTRRWNYNAATQRYTHVNNYYSQYSYYFVTEGDAKTLVQSLAEVPATSDIQTTVPYAVTLDDDKEAWYEGGRRLFDAYNFASGNSRTYKLNLPNLDLTKEKVETYVEYSFSASSTQSNTVMQMTLNGEAESRMTLGAANTLIETAKAQNQSLPYSTATPDLSFEFRTTPGNDARLDYIRVNYPRMLNVAAAPYSFSPQGTATTTLQLADATENTRVWRIGQQGSPTAEIPVKRGENGRYLFTTDTPQRRFVAFNLNAKYPAPEFVEQVENQNLHADEQIDYVIIVPTSGKLVEQAERLANLHRNRSQMKVKVVKANQLYNEFSSGTPDANAYRRYLKMLYDRAATSDMAPKYLLMMGKSPWDNRFLTSDWSKKNLDDYLLAYEVDAQIQSIGTVNSYVTDDFYGMLDDEEGVNIRREKMDLAVGRMVCVTAADAERLVDKVERYMSNKDVGAWKNNVVLIGDDGDANEHMTDAERIAKVLTEKGENRFSLNKIYLDRYTRQSGATGYSYPAATERIKTLMKSGALMFNYSGHGAPYQVAHEKVLHLEDFREALSPHLTLWILASCEIYPFDSKEENLAEASLFDAHGGSIAFMCATRAVYASENSAINQMYSEYVVGRDNKGRRITMGEAMRLAKVYLVTPKADSSLPIDNTMNKLKYVYLGDPALELALPTGNVVLDSINGKAVAAASDFQLSAGSVVRFSGYISRDANLSTVDESFTGEVSAEMMDCTETIVCKDNDGTAKARNRAPFTFTERSRSIFKGSNRVAGGRFEFLVSIPRDISYTDAAARISFYAVNDSTTKEANGYSEAFHLNGTAPQEEPDTLSPKVVAYLNEVGTPDMDVVNSSPTFIAQISDDSGINASGSGMGHDIELYLDNNTNEIVKLNDYFTYSLGSYQSGQVVYPMSGLSLGQHTLTFRVWDVNNNSTTTNLRFVVRDQALSGNQVTATQNPAFTSTSFVTSFERLTDAASQVVLEVYNTKGHLLWKQSQNIAAGGTGCVTHWNLMDAQSRRLDAGVYIYRAVITNTQGTKETPTQKLIIAN